jgi:hypothetical protein
MSGSIELQIDDPIEIGFTGIIPLQSEEDPIFAAWLLSVEEDIDNWDEAYSWGDHAGLYDPVGSVSTHESTYDHSKLHNPVTAGTGISVTGQEVSNSDKGSSAVTTHESTYDHSTLYPIGVGERITGDDSGRYGEMSTDGSYGYLCTVAGIAGVAVWMKWQLTTTEAPSGTFDITFDETFV